MGDIKYDRTVCVGQIYRHFKDKLYQIVAVAKHSETGERLVIYQQLYGKFEVYARPYEMFMSEVDREKYPNVSQRYRFELVDAETLAEPQQNPVGTDIKREGVSANQTGEPESASADKGRERENIPANKGGEAETVPADKVNEAESAPANKAWKAETVLKEEQGQVNPFLMKFLDADTYEEKRNILVRMKGDMTDRLIDDIAASMDVAVEKGDINERYISLLNCVDMMAKYEVNRFR